MTRDTVMSSESVEVYTVMTHNTVLPFALQLVRTTYFSCAHVTGFILMRHQ
uniref:Uncharacterized protein n=1 Tax=Arundo donax TaxID=35708 RepID=A0A0A9FMI4_ARUDO